MEIFVKDQINPRFERIKIVLNQKASPWESIRTNQLFVGRICSSRIYISTKKYEWNELFASMCALGLSREGKNWLN